MTALRCALIILSVIAVSVLSKSMPRLRDRCAVMRCASGSCFNGKCTNNKCPPNMHEEECGTACPARCDLDPAAIMCMAICVKGCVCDEGFVLDKADGVCIRPENCPKSEETPEENAEKCPAKECKAGEICQDEECIRNPNCPMFKMPAPQPGCEYVDEINENNCPIPKEHCPA
uniref:TIL domain-containing protein n=1 Tax=Plectus sambesii TaxID=2011161 RepID=A0A914UPM1_9BILA